METFNINGGGENKSTWHNMRLYKIQDQDLVYKTKTNSVLFICFLKIFLHLLKCADNIYVKIKNLMCNPTHIDFLLRFLLCHITRAHVAIFHNYFLCGN